VTNLREVEAAIKDPLTLLTRADRAWMRRVVAQSVPDPGTKSMAEIEALSPRDRLRFRDQRTRLLRMLPLMETTVAKTVMTQLRVIAASAIANDDQHQQDVPILDGEPGVGKTMLLKSHAVEQMHALAVARSIKLEEGTAAPVGTYRPVVFVHLRGPMTARDLVRLVCDELGWPTDSNPMPVFERAIQRCGVQVIMIDEIQHVNFDGKTGRHVHNVIRWMSNCGLRVIIAGTDADSVLNGVGAADVEVAARNSRGRWIRIDVPRLHVVTEEEHENWLALVDALESRLRLAATPNEPGWLADQFGDYLFARTQGYFNALVLLINSAAAFAMDNGTEVIDRQTLDAVTLEYEVERQRSQRIAAFDAGLPRYTWAS
jgi:hypothetical protein